MPGAFDLCKHMRELPTLWQAVNRCVHFIYRQNRIVSIVFNPTLPTVPTRHFPETGNRHSLCTHQIAEPGDRYLVPL